MSMFYGPSCTSFLLSDSHHRRFEMSSHEWVVDSLEFGRNNLYVTWAETLASGMADVQICCNGPEQIYFIWCAWLGKPLRSTWPRNFLFLWLLNPSRSAWNQEAIQHSHLKWCLSKGGSKGGPWGPCPPPRCWSRLLVYCHYFNSMIVKLLQQT